MSVKKIILSNAQLFDVDERNISNEKDALDVLLRYFHSRQVQKTNGLPLNTSYFIICVLSEIGLMDEAIHLAKDTLKKAERSRQYFLAADLTHKIASYYILIDEWDASEKYQLLFKKYITLYSQHHETIHLFGRAIKNAPNTLSTTKEISSLNKALRTNFSKESPWYMYCHFLLKTFSLFEKELESELQYACEYFEKQNQPFYAGSFYYTLIKYYLTLGDLMQAETHLLKMRKGSWYWFKSYHFFITALLVRKDIRCTELCNEVMSNPKFSFLDEGVKTEWKVLYKKTVKLFLNS